MKIFIKNMYKSIPAGLEITSLPEFVIITGENGSGKSQLLDYIRSYGTDNISTNFINWIPSDWKAAPATQNKQKRQEYENQITTINQNFINSFRQRQTQQQPNHPHEPYFAEIAQILDKNINELTEEEIVQNMPYDIQNKLLVETDFIRLFIAYRNDYDSKCGKANKQGNDDELKRLREIKPPWELINELFESYKFEYRLQEPLGKGHEFNSLVFYHYKNISLKLGLNDLSSGEQIITMLILWSHNPNTGKRYKLLLLDEPDAFLHPSMCKMLMEILLKKIHKEYGIKIIMATHSPSTIAYAPEESIYLMQKKGERFKKECQAAAIRTLSDGMIAFSSNNAEEKLSLLYKIKNSDKDTILLLEGKYDAYHILAAVKKLQKYEPNFEIMDLGCADKLRDFIVSMPEELFGTKKVIGLFDADEKGITKARSIKTGIIYDQYKNCYTCKDRSNIHYMTLPTPHSNMEKLQNCPLEMLYPINLLRKHMMIKKLDLKYVNNKFGQNEQLSSEDWDKLEEHWCYCLDSNANKKTFADLAKDFEVEYFENFKLLLNQIDFLMALTSSK